jgi:hypothetical protein
MIIQPSAFPAFVLTVDLDGLQLLARLSNRSGDYFFATLDYAPDPENVWMVVIEPQSAAALRELDRLMGDPAAYRFAEEIADPAPR